MVGHGRSFRLASEINDELPACQKNIRTSGTSGKSKCKENPIPKICLLKDVYEKQMGKKIVEAEYTECT